MKYKVFVDGQEGTTGLEIHQRLAGRSEIEILMIDPELRKDTKERRRLINISDVTFLCLPDEAAKESVGLVENTRTCILDASTAHRVNPKWTYGIPELDKGNRDRLRESKRISVPGCHATGFVVAIKPLIESGLLPRNASLTCFSLTGYSGGGKKLISYYESELAKKQSAESPRIYSLEMRHKHLPEMAYHTGLESPPIFTPILANIYKGMLVTIPIPTALLIGKPSASRIHEVLASYYENQHFIKVVPFGNSEYLDDGYLEPTACNGTNRLELFVLGRDSQTVISARLDNLGKGASGAAVQCMNIHLGLNESTGLEL